MSRLLWLLLVFADASAQWQYRDATFADGCDDLSGEPINFNLDFNTDIQPIFNFHGCGDCHDGSDGGLDLNPAGGPVILGLLGAGSDQTGGALIEPHQPNQSYLLEKVNCQIPFSGLRMPRSGGVLSLEEQGMVYDWIQQGALGEFPPGLWYREIIARNGFEGLR